jgi:MFS family permease
VLTAADVTLALASDAWIADIGAALWGLLMGAAHGLMTAIIADTAPDDMRATGFGLFNLITGIALLAASAIAGGLWTLFGPSMTFHAGAAFAAVALIGPMAVTRHNATVQP